MIFGSHFCLKKTSKHFDCAHREALRLTHSSQDAEFFGSNISQIGSIELHVVCFRKGDGEGNEILTCDPLIGSDLLINSDSDLHAHFKAGQIGQQRTPFFFFSNL